MLDEQKKTGEEVFHRRFAQISADFLKKEKRGLVFSTLRTSPLGRLPLSVQYPLPRPPTAQNVSFLLRNLRKSA
jgi:hypothetical protein